MRGAAGFFAQFFPIFLLGALFGKLMEDSGSVQSVARFVGTRLGTRRAILAVVLAGALVTYGGVSLFVAFFVLAPMALALFRDANIPRRLMPAAIGLGTSTFTMSALPGSPAVQKAIPMPFFGTTPFAAPGLGAIAALIMLAFGLWWLALVEARARRRGLGFDAATTGGAAPDASSEPALVSVLGDPDVTQRMAETAADTRVREHITVASEFDPIEAPRGAITENLPPIFIAVLPLFVVIAVNLAMTALVLPALDLEFLTEPRWGPTTPAAVSGIWSVSVALAVAILVLIALNRKRLRSLRDSIDAGLNASVLPVISVASLVGFGTVVADLPAFQLVRDWVLGIEGGPLVSLAVSTNVLAALTGSASGGLSIALESLGATYMQLAGELGIDPALMHRVAVIGAGTLDMLPHNGAVVTLLAVCGVTHRDSYLDMVMACIVSALLALVAVIVLGTLFGSF